MNVDPLLLTNWLLRGAAMAAALLLAALLLREHGHRLAARLGALLGLGAAAFVLGTAPGFAGRLEPWQAPVLGLSAGNAMVFWLFTRALLDDGFRLQRWHVAGWLTLVALGASNCLLVRPLGVAWARGVGASIDMATVVLAALAVAQAVLSWREDLVEERRRLRLVIVGGVGGHIFLTQAVARLTGEPHAAAFSGLGNALGLFALLAFIAWRLLRLPGHSLLAALEPARDAVEAPPRRGEPLVTLAEAAPGDTDEPATDALHAPDPQQLAQLHELMTVEQVYREDKLTIGSLAQRMGLAEHRLRRVINQGLGHRNFAAFLNTYRVEDAKRALADARYDAVPILTIAMEAGFQSLGPFNRAFKAATGSTPSDYRRAAREGGAAPAPAVAESSTALG